MVELGQLERRHGDFEKRNVRILAISNDAQDVARATQSDFQHVGIVSDADQKMAKALGAIHPGAGPGNTDTNAPTTFLVDGNGTVRWLYRPGRFTDRLSPDELLAAIDRTWPAN